ncbi:MAG: DNRLRE domain-containing protein [Candidatus Paceibacterota bacterium]|jgi:hypothetical protein
MKKTLITIGIITLFTSNGVLASTYTSYPSQDTFYGTSYLTGPNGSATVTHIGGWGDNYYTFTQFDLTDSPTSGITSAVLYYHATSTNTISPLPLIYRITSSWDASTMTKTSGVPTYDATSYSFSPAWANAIGWNTVDITTMYNQWVGGTYTNYGVTLRHTDNDPNSDTMIDSKESSTVFIPYILVTYSDAVNPSSLKINSGRINIKSGNLIIK